MTATTSFKIASLSAFAALLFGCATTEQSQPIDEQKTQSESIQGDIEQARQKNPAVEKDTETPDDRIARTRKATDVIDPELRRMQTQGSKAPRVTRPMKM